MILLIDATIETVSRWAQVVGLPLLFVIFVSKGMLIGKIFPTSVFLPGYVLAIRASVTMAMIIAVVTAIGYIIGQCVVYIGTQRYGRSFVSQLPYATVDPESPKFQQFDEWFLRYGGLSLFATNFVPWLRGLLTIPAAASSYPTHWYLFHTTASTTVYHILYVSIALGLLELLM